MADPEPGEEARPASAPDFSGSALRRAPATIEGRARDLTPPNDEESAAGAVDEASGYNVVGHVDELDRPPEAIEPAVADDAMAEETAPAAPDAAADIPSSSQPARSGRAMAPLLLALIIGAAAGFAGAFGWTTFDKLDTKVESLSQQVTSLAQAQTATTGLADAQTDLATRLKAVEAVAQTDETALVDLRRDVEKLAARKPAAPAAGSSADLGPLTHDVGALKDKLAALATQVGDLSSKLDAQKSQVAATQHMVTQTAAAHADETAAALIVGSLLRKAEAGVPFADDLSELADRGIDKTKLAALTPAATAGVATPRALSKQFAAETDAILSTAPGPRAHGFFDRLMKHAEGLVQVRKVGETNGDSLAARVARVQNALDGGSVETAYQDWMALPDAAKTKSQPFGTAAKLRLDVIAAARAVEAEALASLGKAKS